MISKREALRLIESTSKYRHALIVASMMRKLAKRLRADEDKWELVGLLHDLDYDSVRKDMSKHGIVAGETLNRRLPSDGLQAIRSHDHRTGIKPKSELDKALVVADTVVAIAMEEATRGELTAESLEREIETISASKPWYRTTSGDQMS